MILKNLFSGKVVVDAYAADENIVKFFPVEESVKHTPVWWKHLPTEYKNYSDRGVEHPSSTMKRCVGFVELYRKSFTLPLWSDVAISTNENGDWAYYSTNQDFVIESHDRNQFGEQFNDYVHLKLICPWAFNDKKGINFMLSSPVWNNVDLWNRLHIVPGFFEFKYQFATNINLFVNRIPQNIQLSAGMPIGMLTPLTEKKVKIKMHHVSQKEYEDICSGKKQNYFFTHAYRKKLNFIKGKK